MLDWRVAWREFRVVTSPCSVAIVACKERVWETRDCAAVSDWLAWVWRVSARVWDTARRRASFSGFGGMGGAGPLGANEGSSSSNGEVRRSGASDFDAGTAGAGGGRW